MAAAGLWTTPRELLLVIRALQSSLKGTNDSFLWQEWARLMLTAVHSKYACGWKAPAGSGVIDHGGSNLPGYRCVLLGWAGYWGEKWHLLHGERPTLKFAYLPPVRLLPAAVVPRKYDDERMSIDLVAEGLEVMLRLGWENGERIVEIRPGQESEADVLRRTHV